MSTTHEHEPLHLELKDGTGRRAFLGEIPLSSSQEHTHSHTTEPHTHPHIYPHTHTHTEAHPHSLHAEAHTHPHSHSASSHTHPHTHASESQKMGLLPPANSLLQSGVFGALLGSATSGINGYAEYKKGNKTQEQVVNETVKSGLQGAATMVVANIATNIVRSNPVLGVATLVAGGIGAYLLMQDKNTTTVTNVEANGEVVANIEEN